MSAHHLVGPDISWVEAVELTGSHLIFARIADETALEGGRWYRVTRHGAAMGCVRGLP